MIDEKWLQEKCDVDKLGALTLIETILNHRTELDKDDLEFVTNAKNECLNTSSLSRYHILGLEEIWAKHNWDVQKEIPN